MELELELELEQLSNFLKVRFANSLVQPDSNILPKQRRHSKSLFI